MRLRCLVPTLLLSGLLVVLGCDKKQEEMSTGEPAGRVVDSTGEVTGQQPDAESRSLNVNDIVFQDDTIITGDESSVGILLTHNNARWELGSNSTRRIDQSAAFRAKKQSVAVLRAQEPVGTSAAGRNTTREAAASKATLLPEVDVKAINDDAPKADRGTAGAGAGAGAGPTRRNNKRPNRSEGKRRNNVQGAIGAGPAPKSMPSAAEAAQELAEDSGKKSDNRATNLNSTIRSRARRCHKKHGGKGTITYQFDATKGLSAKGSHPSLDPLIACLQRALPPSKNAPTVKSSLRFE